MTQTTKKVLIVKSSPVAHGSVSNEIADFLASQLHDKGELYEIRTRDLAQAPPPLYNTPIFQAIYGTAEQDQQDVLGPSNEYIRELKEADLIVFASPMHNFSVSALLKAYIDQICRMGETFQYHADGPEGLLKNKQAVIISSAGGDFQQELEKHKDFQTPYLTHVLNFIGIENIVVVPVQGMGLGADIANQSRVRAKEQLTQLVSATF